MQLRFLTILALLLMLALPAYALDLHDARNAGLIGETPEGYVEAIRKGEEVIALVNEINDKREQEYIRISKENGQPVAVVGKIAAEKIINNLEPGNYYQGPDGEWKKR